jgi:hypothetical protein
MDEIEVRQRLEDAYSVHNPNRREMRDAINYGISNGRSKPIYIPELQPRWGDPRPKIDPETGEVITPDPTSAGKKRKRARLQYWWSWPRVNTSTMTPAAPLSPWK